jgi:hypothetical protein
MVLPNDSMNKKQNGLSSPLPKKKNLACETAGDAPLIKGGTKLDFVHLN